MMKLSMIGRAAFAGVVALALGFGAREAAAAPEGQASARRPYCEDQADCQATCELMYPGYTKIGFCSSGHTCYC
jgi:hypothetical protein